METRGFGIPELGVWVGTVGVSGLQQEFWIHGVAVYSFGELVLSEGLGIEAAVGAWDWFQLRGVDAGFLFCAFDLGDSLTSWLRRIVCKVSQPSVQLILEI